MAFIALNSCSVKGWSPPKSPTTYSIERSDGRTRAVISLPRNETIFAYSEDRGTSWEANLSTSTGIYATHYFGRLWHVEGPSQFGGLLDYRLYPDDFRPVVISNKVEQNFIDGLHEEVFPDQRARTLPVFLFSDDTLEFERMILSKHPLDPLMLEHKRSNSR